MLPALGQSAKARVWRGLSSISLKSSEAGQYRKRPENHARLQIIEAPVQDGYAVFKFRLLGGGFLGGSHDST